MCWITMTNMHWLLSSRFWNRSASFPDRWPNLTVEESNHDQRITRVETSREARSRPARYLGGPEPPFGCMLHLQFSSGGHGCSASGARIDASDSGSVFGDGL